MFGCVILHFYDNCTYVTHCSVLKLHTFRSSQYNHFSTRYQQILRGFGKQDRRSMTEILLLLLYVLHFCLFCIKLILYREHSAKKNFDIIDIYSSKHCFSLFKVKYHSNTLIPHRERESNKALVKIQCAKVSFLMNLEMKKVPQYIHVTTVTK